MQTVWKGAVSFGLVNVPVKMFTATHDNDIPMKMLHKEFNVPIQYHRTCPKCEENVGWNEIVKGYEYEPGHFVTFEKKELEKLASETSREIRILDFVDLSEIDPIYFQKTYYLAPEESGEHAYNLLVEALLDTKKIGIANVSIRSKSSLAAVRIVDGVLSMSTMYYAEEIRPKEQIPNLPKQTKVDERELEMARMLIDQLAAPFEPGKYEDEYRERLMDAIEDKVEGKEVKVAPEEKKTNVIDLMDALKASLKMSKEAVGAKEGGNGEESENTPVSKPTAKRSAKTGSKPASKSKSKATARSTSSRSAAKSPSAGKTTAKPRRRKTGS
ncbi:Ku protein [Paenibacillus sp. YPG26]|uniref:non-homologous end joining protein Ku n=1 Tax=Paenibacillus sp. YPG26 TaxID=2878915 RepID=UPI00203BDEC3|nr:Ku protein [Paenibacillus sp. YPG26]USB31839.1 Ku protein [Paenibacillus sp. YPG26]